MSRFVQRPSDLDHNILVLFGHIHRVEVCRLSPISCPTNTTTFQGIRGHFQEQGPRGVLWVPNVGEIGDGTRIGLSQTSDIYGILSTPNRCFQYVCDGCGPPAHANTKLIRHRVR